MATNNCDGSYLKKIWFEKSSSEVLFKGKYIPQYPWGEEPHWAPDDAPYQKQTREIGGYCHVTHTRQLHQIKEEPGKYILKPNQKKGKDHYDKHVDGTTMTLRATYTPVDPTAASDDNTEYRIIQPHEEVLPGHYIWWSPHWPFNKKCISDQYNPADFFKFPPHSAYGSKKIRAMSHPLFKSYQAAFLTDDKYPKLEFRCGGTLRYKREICYVVIVCAQGHFTGALETQYPILQGFINIDYKSNGRVKFVKKWNITIRNGIQSGHGSSYSWDHYALAFYYPDDTKQMELTSNKNVWDEDVEHDPDHCIKNVKGICPDKL